MTDGPADDGNIGSCEPESGLCAGRWRPTAPVFLIGYRCVGKTTTARLVAERLGWQWKDADLELEGRSGLSIGRIISEKGVGVFRDLEAAALEGLCRRENHIIATGGGAVLRAENRQRLRASGRIVWLTADVETIQARLEADPASGVRRPALGAGGRAEIEKALKDRAPLYEACADWTVETCGRSAEAVAAAVASWLEERRSLKKPDFYSRRS